MSEFWYHCLMEEENTTQHTHTKDTVLFHKHNHLTGAETAP